MKDMEHSINIMDTEADIWGIHSSPLSIAHEHGMYDVVAHTLSVEFMNRRWNNQKKVCPTSTIKVNKKKLINS